MARSFWAGALIVIGCVLVPAGALAIWLDGTLLDTDKYVETVAPLPQEPEIADAVAEALVDEALTELDRRPAVRALAERRIAQADVGAGSLLGYVEQRVADAVSSDHFERTWVTANRAAHPLLVEALTGDRGVERVELDLSPAVARALDDAAAELGVALPRPEGIGRVELVRGEQVAAARRGARNLQRWADRLPLVALAALVLGVLLARRRLRALVMVGLISALLGFATIVLLGRAREAVVDHSGGDDLSDEALAAIWDTLTRGLADMGWMIVGAGLLLAVLAGAATRLVPGRR